MTGRYPFRTGVVDNGAGSAARPDKEMCIARVMKQAGYVTAVAGKWRQLQYFSTKEDGQRWGFDEFVVWGVEGNKGERYWDPVYTGTANRYPTARASTAPTCSRSSLLTLSVAIEMSLSSFTIRSR
jgi:arylsulfatase A-like enzyme